jgi:hypothetical protein
MMCHHHFLSFLNQHRLYSLGITSQKHNFTLATFPILPRCIRCRLILPSSLQDRRTTSTYPLMVFYLIHHSSHKILCFYSNQYTFIVYHSASLPILRLPAKQMIGTGTQNFLNTEHVPSSLSDEVVTISPHLTSKWSPFSAVSDQSRMHIRLYAITRHHLL